MLFGALWCFVIHKSLDQPRKSTKKHGFWMGGGEEHGCLPRKRIKTTKKHQKAPKSTKGRAFWCIMVHCHPPKPIPTTKNHQKAPKSTKKHRFWRGGASAIVTHTNLNKPPKCTKKHQKGRILGGRRGKTCTEKHRGSRSVRQGQAQETAEDVLRPNVPRWTPLPKMA